MYIMWLTSYEETNSGYFTSVKINRSEECLTKYSGKSHVEPRLTQDISKAKVWKTESAAIKYANTLAGRLQTARYNRQLPQPYRYCMKWDIVVYELETQREIHRVRHYARNSTC